jgi:hypothetical protein
MQPHKTPGLGSICRTCSVLVVLTLTMGFGAPLVHSAGPPRRGPVLRSTSAPGTGKPAVSPEQRTCWISLH